jgi:hypothetical protein
MIVAGCNGQGLSTGSPDLGAACAAARDTASCNAIAGCTAVGCPNCNGGIDFAFCNPDGQPYGLDCPNLMCELQSCSSIHDAQSCDARPDCWSLWSGDLPCNNTQCSNHFVSCNDGSPVCATTGVCNGSCTMLTPTCRDGDAPVFSNSCCATGCAHANRCPGAVACSSDDQCGGQEYCRGMLQVCGSQCQLTIGTLQTGVCHRSCVGRDAHCTCVDDSDCPGFFTTCDVASGTCKSAAPPVCHASCPAGCTDTSDKQSGEICVCNACP